MADGAVVQGAVNGSHDIHEAGSPRKVSQSIQRRHSPGDSGVIRKAVSTPHPALI